MSLHKSPAKKKKETEALVDLVAKLSVENVELRTQLESACQQVQLLSAVLRIVHEDVHVKSEQLEVLYSNLESNPIWCEYLKRAEVEYGTISESSSVSSHTKEEVEEKSSFSIPRIAEFTGGFGCDDLIMKPKTRAKAVRPSMKKMKRAKSVKSRRISKTQKPKHVRSASVSVLSDESLLQSMARGVTLAKSRSLSPGKKDCMAVGSETAKTTLGFAVADRCLLEELPNEMQLEVCTFLNFDELCVLSVANSYWHSLVNDDNVWRHAFANRWGLTHAEVANGELMTAAELGIADISDSDDSRKSAIEEETISEECVEWWKQTFTGPSKKRKRKASIDAITDTETDSSAAVISRAKAKRKAKTTISSTSKKRVAKKSKKKTEEISEVFLAAKSLERKLRPYSGRKTWKQQFYERMEVERCWRQSRAKLMTLASHSGAVTALKFDKYKMVTASDDGCLILWQIGDMRKEWRKLRRREAGIECSVSRSETVSDSELLEEVSYRKYAARRNRELLWARRPLAGGSAVAATPGSVVQNHHKHCELNFKQRSFHGHGGPVWCLDFDEHLVASGSYDKCVKVWDALGGSCVATLRGHHEWVSAVRIRGRHVVSGSWDASIRVWQLNEDRTEGRSVAKLQSRHGDAVYCLQWSADKRLVVAGCRYSALQMWDLAKGKMLRTYMGHTKQVYACHWHGSLLCSGSADQSVKLWDVRTAACVAKFKAHTGPVMAVQFDGHKVASAGYDKSVHLFDIRNAKVMQSLYGHSKAIFAMQYDQKKIVTGAADRLVLVWNFN